jgi:hypothetical protein
MQRESRTTRTVPRPGRSRGTGGEHARIADSIEPIRESDEPIRESDEPIRESDEPIRESDEPIRESDEPTRGPILRLVGARTLPNARPVVDPEP